MLASLALIALGQFHNQRPKPFTPARPDLYFAPEHKTVLCEVAISMEGERSHAYFPVPQDYTGQIVSDFKVEADPPSLLQSWKWHPGKTQATDWLEIISSPETKGQMTWKARVFSPVDEVYRTQVKNNFSDWMKSTRLVESHAEQIAALAKKLKSESKDEDEFVKNVTHWVAFNQTQERRGLTSLAAFHLGGNSRGRAALAAALFRANGVAARLVIYVPTAASAAEGLQWLTEYQADEGNWQMIEPTIGVDDVARSSVVVLKVLSLGDEEKLGSGLRGGQLPDEPIWDSVYKVSVRRLRTFTVPLAPRVVTAALGHFRSVIDLALQGRNSWRDDKEFEAAMNTSNSNFSLYLEGKPELNKKG